MPVPYRHVIVVPGGVDSRPETLAPLTDAGLTPYRGRRAAAGGEARRGRTVVVSGIGGLGSNGSSTPAYGVAVRP